MIDRKNQAAALLGLCLWASAALAQQPDESRSEAPDAGVAPAPAPAAPPAPPPAPAPDSVKRVIYIPESVRAELREELKKEVLEQARAEGWAAPGLVPSWLARLKISGDVRARFERIIFGRNNANSGEFPDFNAINSGKPFDVNFVDPSEERYLDVDQNRTLPRFRARLGFDAALPQGFSTGLRLASGDSGQPVSAFQTLGGSGGDFSRYQFWIDRAYIKYESPKELAWGLALSVGRFESPFLNTELLFNDSINFDGVAAQGRWTSPRGVFSPFLTGGAFPLYTTAVPFPVEETAKLHSTNKWLYAVQGGTGIAFGPQTNLQLGFAFYDFDKVEGHVSESCDTNLSYVTCDTDDDRPSYAQKGNTYMALRSPSAAALALESVSTVSRYQYFGLASRFRELVVTARFVTPLSSWLLVTADVEAVHNPGFVAWEVDRVALNNRGAVGSGALGPLQAGNNGALGRIALGSPTQDKRGDFRFALTYRYLESDAVMDAFNDADFGLGGTNMKGYSLEASYGIVDGVKAVARWFSSDEIGGPPMAIDVLELDLAARF